MNTICNHMAIFMATDSAFLLSADGNNNMRFRPTSDYLQKKIYASNYENWRPGQRSTSVLYFGAENSRALNVYASRPYGRAPQ